MVLQDTWLFGGTIRDNIAYGRPGATEEEILAAARGDLRRPVRARAARRLRHRHRRRGQQPVAPGEQQLITIARAFLAEPSLLILDEATSSVDTRTEVLVQQAMAALRSDRTSFVIAHRLSTIRDADLILVMEHGRIVEQGTHDELLGRARGAYYELYNAQFARRPRRSAARPDRVRASDAGERHRRSPPLHRADCARAERLLGLSPDRGSPRGQVRRAGRTAAAWA